MRFLDDLKITLPDLPGALCADPSIPADVFHPQGKLELFAVLPMVVKLCNACPEKAACLEFAVNQKIFDGLWAGTTGHERRLMAMNQSKRGKGKKVSKSESQSTKPKASSKLSTSSELLP
jgi:hypothetical protein